MHLLHDLLLLAVHWGVLLSLLLMFLELRTKLLMLSLVSVGRKAGSGVSFFPLSHSSAPNGQLNTSSLEQRCLHFLAQGLAPSTRKAYASGINVSLPNFAIKTESSTPMAHLALLTSGHSACLFFFLQIQFSIHQ